MKRRLVISDIHGCSNTLKTLVEKLALSKKDKLFFLGDYIDRGHDSSGVLDFIMKLQEKDYRIYPLMGNHEHQTLLAEEEYKKEPELFKYYVSKINKSPDILNKNGVLKKKYKAFMSSLLPYVELKDFFIVHAGFNFQIKNTFTNKKSYMYIRKFDYDYHKAKGKAIVHGHVPTSFNKISKLIEDNSFVLPLDNGCIYNKPHKIYDYTKLGRLCCLDLDNMKLTFQINID